MIIKYVRFYMPFREKSRTCAQTLPDGNYIRIPLLLFTLVTYYGKAGEFEITNSKLVEKFSLRARNRRMQEEKRRSHSRIAFMPNANFCFDADHPTSFGWRTIDTTLSGQFATFSRRSLWLFGPELHSNINSQWYLLFHHWKTYFTCYCCEKFQGLRQIY